MNTEPVFGLVGWGASSLVVSQRAGAPACRSAGTVKHVNSNSNGLGAPNFVTDLVPLFLDGCTVVPFQGYMCREFCMLLLVQSATSRLLISALKSLHP